MRLSIEKAIVSSQELGLKAPKSKALNVMEHAIEVGKSFNEFLKVAEADLVEVDGIFSHCAESRENITSIMNNFSDAR